MSWHYLQGQEVVSSEAIYWDGGVFAPSKSRTILGGYCLPDSVTASCPDSPSGTTSALSMEPNGGDGLTSLPGDSPARTSVQPGKGQESQAPVPVYGLRWPALSVKFDPDTASWRIAPCLFPEDSIQSSVTLPRWGTMRNGELSERTTPEPHTGGNESGYLRSIPTPTCSDAYTSKLESSQTADHTMHSVTLARLVEREPEKMWPTPTTRDHKDGETPYYREGKMQLDTLGRQVRNGGHPTRRTWPTLRVRNIDYWDSEYAEKKQMLCDSLVDGALNPDWVEWLMGWPIGWTDLKLLATDRFRQWCALHGISSEVDE